MRLKPSNIFYSQDSIGATFGRCTRHSDKDIGETLDELYNGDIGFRKIPRITVVEKDGKWFTTDNRRLWIFHHLEAVGKCDTIPVIVKELSEVSSSKFTTTNGGVSVEIYMDEDPGGECHRFITPVTPRPIDDETSGSDSTADNQSNPITNTNNGDATANTPLDSTTNTNNREAAANSQSDPITNANNGEAVENKGADKSDTLQPEDGAVVHASTNDDWSYLRRSTTYANTSSSDLVNDHVAKASSSTSVSGATPSPEKGAIKVYANEIGSRMDPSGVLRAVRGIKRSSEQAFHNEDVGMPKTKRGDTFTP